jgi:hypothetical protein
MDREVLCDQAPHWRIAEMKDHQHARQQQQALAAEQHRNARWSRRAVVMGKSAGDIMIDVLWLDCKH